MDDLKSKLIFENGNAFIKDENGNIQKNVQTGEPLPVEGLVASYKTNPIYKDFVVNPMANKNGANVKGDAPAQAQTEENPYSEIFN